MLKVKVTRSLAALVMIASVVVLIGAGALPPGVSWT